MKAKFKSRDIAGVAIVLVVVAIVMAIPGIPAQVKVTSTYSETVIQSQPYTVTETQQETVHHTSSIVDRSKHGLFFAGYGLQSYLQICFSLYPAESINSVISDTSSYIIETGGNTQKQKMKVRPNFDSSSPFGVAGDGSICIPKTGRDMHNCQIIASWDMNQNYNWDSRDYEYANCPFVCFHNSPLLIPVSSDSNPSTVTIYKSQDRWSNGCKGSLTLNLADIEAAKIWFSMRLPPDYDQYTFNINELKLDYAWDETQTTNKTVTKYRDVPVQVEKQRAVIDYRNISVWQRIFGK